MFNKPYDFRAGHSTENALLELIGQISYSFKDKWYSQGTFNSSSKAFDTVDHLKSFNIIE